MGSNDVLRGRHRPIPAIRARPTDLTDARRARTQSFCRYRRQSRSQPRRPRSNRLRARWCFCRARTRMLCGRRCARTSQVLWSRSRSGSIPSAWETVVVKGEADVERARARRWLYLCARDVLGAAMRWLSISSVGTHVRVDWVRNLVSSPLLSTGQCTPCVEGHL